MPAEHTNQADYSQAIARLAAEVEDCLGAAGGDREAQLQRAAFQERLTRARRLAERLGAASHAERQLLDGDAWRAREALELSRDFFRRRASR
jgi:hypothetical protein